MNHFAMLETMGVVRVSGPDARAFLQGQLTADLRKLSPAAGALAAWCNPQGRVLFLAFLAMQGDDFLLFLPSSEIERCVKRLRMYVLRAKVTVTDLQAEWCVAGLLANDAGDGAAFTSKPVAELLWLSLPGAGLSLLAGPKADVEAWLAREAHLPVTELDWNARALEAGLPRVEGPTTERFLPQQLNLDRLGVMSFDKGCYPGQEVIARLKYRGQVRQRLRIGSSASALQPGQRLYRAEAGAGQNAGEVLQVVAVDGIWRCTAVIDIDCTEPLFAEAPGGIRVDFAPPSAGD